jgi:hypothetical protein
MRQLIALAVGVFVAATLAQSALASGGSKVTLGPAGYNGPGNNRSLVLAGTANVALGTEDHVVICHAIGGPKGTDFNQIAPSASGVAIGHGSHEGDRDIIPPFVYSYKGAQDTSLATGNNWSAATAAIYANGCNAPAQTPPTTPTPPTDVCPNIEGIQTAVPSGMSKDAAGNCITPPVVTTVPSPPTTTTIVVEKLVVEQQVVHVTKKAVAKAKKAKKAKKAVKKHKAKKHKKVRVQVKGVRKAFKPSVLPHTR